MVSLNTTNTVGRLYVYYRMIPLICIGCLLLSAGAGIGLTPNPYRGHAVQGRVVQRVVTPCDTYTRKNGKHSTATRHKCKVKYVYTVKGVEYKHTDVIDVASPLSEGSTLRVNYNPSDPNDHKVNYGDPLLAAGVLSAVGCCMCCIGTVVILTSQKVKGAATTFMVGNVARRVLKN